MKKMNVVIIKKSIHIFQDVTVETFRLARQRYFRLIFSVLQGNITVSLFLDNSFGIDFSRSWHLFHIL
jgi:hypothetical protein